MFPVKTPIEALLEQAHKYRLMQGAKNADESTEFAKLADDFEKAAMILREIEMKLDFNKR